MTVCYVCDLPIAEAYVYAGLAHEAIGNPPRLRHDRCPQAPRPRPGWIG